MRFINDDVELKHCERIAAYSSSVFDLANQIETMAAKCGFNKNACGAVSWHQNDAIAHKAIKAIMKNDATINNDNTFGVNVENFMCQELDRRKGDIGKSLLGWNFIEHGLSFYGFTAGGDGNYGVFMILYHDGKDVRLYTPRWGNKLNIKRQEPLAHDGRSEKYIAKYNLNKKTLGFNWDAMRIDILANIRVNYSNLIQSHLLTIEREEE